MRKSVFIKMLGETPFIKVIDFLLDNYIFDYSKTEVAREIRISRMTIEPIWKDMVKQKIIIKIKKVGNASLYRLDTKNPIVMKLRELDILLADMSYTTEKMNMVKQEAPISMPA